MKPIFLMSLIIFCFLLLNCTGAENNIVGKYKAVKHASGYFEFTDDGHFIVYGENRTPRVGTYKIDDSKSPKYLDISMDADNSNPDGVKGKDSSAAGIYKFEGNKLVIKSARGNLRDIHPKDFGECEIGSCVNLELERYDHSIPDEYQSVPVDIPIATPPNQ